MKKYSILLLIAISFIACKSRKVATEISKSTDKTKTEETSEVKTVTNVEIKNQSKTVTTSSDSSKKVEDENVSIKADSISYNKVTGEIKAKGNVQANFKKRTNTNNKINKSLLQSNDVKVNASSKSDSAGKKKENKNVTEFKKSKNIKSEPSGLGWWALGIAGVFLGWAYIVLWPKIKAKLKHFV